MSGSVSITPSSLRYLQEKMLDYCKISSFDGLRYHSLDICVTEIITAVLCANIGRSPEEAEVLLRERISDIVQKYSKVSIGQSLEKLHSIATTGKELDGDKDGLDALTYHLSGDTCFKGMAALQAVINRFNEQEDI